MANFGSAPVLDNVFHENFCNESDDSSNESFDGENGDKDEVHITEVEECLGAEERMKTKLGITEEQVRVNYLAAGAEVEEESEGITVAANSHLIDPTIDSVLNSIVNELNLPYIPSEFQRVSVNTVCQLNHLILISPTGSGKMDVPLLATLVLRKRLGISKGVAIVTQPLTSIMNQKIKNNICDVAVLSMAGELRGSSGRNEDADLSCDVSDLLDGKFPVLLGHPESFESPLGQNILRELQRLDRLILVCIDEFHQGGLGRLLYVRV